MSAPKADNKIRDAVPDDQLKNLQTILTKAKASQSTYSSFTQEQVDVIFRCDSRIAPLPARAQAVQPLTFVATAATSCPDRAAAMAANAARIPLAEMAVKETRMGVMEDKASAVVPVQAH